MGETMMRTIKGPAIFLAQFMGDEAPFNSLEGLCQWAADLGYKGIQIPTWESALIDLYSRKSATLYASTAKTGALFCGATPEHVQVIYEAVHEFGLAYQFMDDVADVTGGLEEVGKEGGKDADKMTAIDLYGIEGAKQRATQMQNNAIDRLAEFGPRAEWLRTLISEASWKRA